MKRTLTFVSVAILLIMSMVGCSILIGSALNGTWTNKNGETFTFKKDDLTYTYKKGSDPEESGSFDSSFHYINFKTTNGEKKSRTFCFKDENKSLFIDMAHDYNANKIPNILAVDHSPKDSDVADEEKKEHEKDDLENTPVHKIVNKWYNWYEDGSTKHTTYLDLKRKKDGDVRTFEYKYDDGTAETGTWEYKDDEPYELITLSESTNPALNGDYRVYMDGNDTSEMIFVSESNDTNTSKIEAFIDTHKYTKKDEQ